jgi:mobilization protein NikA
MNAPLTTIPIKGAKRPPARTRTISARVTEEEYAALQNLAWATGRTVGDWARDSLLPRLENRWSSEGLEQHLFTELVGVQLLLMNTLGPLLRGERMTADELNTVFRQVQSIKSRKAQELLNKRHSQQAKP